MVPPAKRPLIQARLDVLLRSHGFDSWESFLDHVASDPTGCAADGLADAVSTGHTYFFREPDHFEYLRERILPELERRVSRLPGRKIRIWCAAAATGEEAYSIAFTLLDFFGARFRDRCARIVASDISAQALERAADGTFSEQQLGSVPLAFRRYFRPVAPGRYRVQAEARSGLDWRQINLKTHDLQFEDPFDIIFCRNVMIYFDRASRARVTRQLRRAISPGGYLIVGHVEAMRQDDLGFSCVRPAVYRNPAWKD